mmetsp:Transcript_34917/g.76833  ORF Transcript_34917/g.76833 Transcript_34917/m.76833 type:complete len:150 (+) Transcript_34917:131-580(+)
MALAPTAVPVALRAMDAATLLHALSNPLPRRVRMRMQENGCEIHGPARRTERSSTHSWASQTEKWFALSPFKDGWFSSPAAASIGNRKIRRRRSRRHRRLRPFGHRSATASDMTSFAFASTPLFYQPVANAMSPPPLYFLRLCLNLYVN